MTRAHGSPTNEGEVYRTCGADYVFRDTGTKNAAGAASLDEGIQDTTAESLFRELKAESEAGDPTDEFEGLSPESIVDDADGHQHEQFTDGGQAIAAGSEVESLLIPDRSEGDEFHWVDPEPAGAEDGNETHDEGDSVDAAPADLFETDDDTDDSGSAVDGVGEDGVRGAAEAGESEPDAADSGGLFSRVLALLGLA